MGRRPIGDVAMTGAERIRRWRETRGAEKAATKPLPTDTALAARVKELEAELAELRKNAAPLSMSAQQRLDAAMRRERHNLQASFDAAVGAAIKKLIDETVLPSYRRDADAAASVIKARKGVMPREDYRLILSCLHPDQSASPERLRKAFDIFMRHELVLCAEKEMPTTLAATAMPRNFAEMQKAAEAAKAKRKRKRQANGVQRR